MQASNYSVASWHYYCACTLFVELSTPPLMLALCLSTPVPRQNSQPSSLIPTPLTSSGWASVLRWSNIWVMRVDTRTPTLLTNLGSPAYKLSLESTADQDRKRNLFYRILASSSSPFYSTHHSHAQSALSERVMANPFSFSQAVFFKRETATPINQGARILDFVAIGLSLPRNYVLSMRTPFIFVHSFRLPCRLKEISKFLPIHIQPAHPRISIDMNTQWARQISE